MGLDRKCFNRCYGRKGSLFDDDFDGDLDLNADWDLSD